MSAANDPDPLTDSAVCTGDPLARALSHLEPMPTALSRDQLMFAAGSAGRDREVAFWKRVVYGQAAAACVLVGVGLTILSLPESAPTRGGDNLAATPPKPPPAVKPAAEPVSPPALARVDAGDAATLARYLQLRSDVLTGGLNVLPNPNAPAGSVDVARLEDSLDLPRGTFAAYAPKASPKSSPDAP